MKATAAGTAQPTMRAAILLFACFAALAAGMVELSISAGYLVGSPSTIPGTAVAGAAALLWGLAFLAWSLIGLNRGNVLFPRRVALAMGAAAAVHVAVIAGGLIQAQRSLDVSHLAVLGLILMTLGGAGWLHRQRTASARVSNDGGAHGQPRTGWLLAAAFGAAVVVASVATPGMAASFAGQHAVPHGEHGQAPAGTPNPGHHH